MSKAEKTRQYIIEKTASVFNERGYAGTSLSDLEKATGLTKGSIYGNFLNKDEIAVAAFKYNIAQVSAHLKSKLETKKNAVDKLLCFPEVYRSFYKLPFLHGGCPILNTSTEADDTHPLLREEAKMAINGWRSSVERVILEGIDAKQIKKSVDAKAFATVIIALIEGTIMISKVSDNRSVLNYTMDFLEERIRELKV